LGEDIRRPLTHSVGQDKGGDHPSVHSHRNQHRTRTSVVHEWIVAVAVNALGHKEEAANNHAAALDDALETLTGGFNNGGRSR